ncbi:glycosyltransferase [archaeon]|jgi:glycosyltransferase involved in cell wall biosynthesis|nr:glycosyltransferase [archaeon]MBT4373542.1 glycosyltransferase [archaeon]MBT4531990.1 glycosyltransferase [archaeon]MBT7001657.1 glycosyltransferase [archaeon]MBT7282451.1 glycosyltransferase [archaeon]
MKILFQCPKYLPDLGGIEISTSKIAKELIQRGHEVSVLCEKTSDSQKDFEIMEKVKVFRFLNNPLGKFFNFLNFQSLQISLKKYGKKFYKENKFDIIISRAFFFIKPTKQIIPKTPLMYIQPSVGYIAMQKSAENSPWIRKKISRYLKSLISYSMEKRALKNADRTLSRSKSMDQIIQKVFHSPKEKIGKFTQIANLKDFQPREKDAKLLEKLQIKNKKIVLTISRLSPDKNNLELIDIFKNTNPKNSVLLIVGGGSQENEIKEKIKKLKMKNKIIMVGEQKNTKIYYNLADIFVTTSKQEGFPNVFLEAMASGIPIIGFKENPPEITIPTNEIIQSKKIGFAVKDKKEFSKKINILLKNGKLRNQMKQKAIEEVKKYSSKKICDNLLLEINKIMPK